MRALILVAGLALSLAACGNDDQAGNTMNTEQGLTAESIVANDVTAIDAVTGDAANMAAEMDINFTNEMLDTGGNAATGRAPAPRPRAPATGTRPPRSAPPSAPEAEQPAANTATNATENETQ